jgi:hypothetical protein
MSAVTATTHDLLFGFINFMCAKEGPPTAVISES